MTDGIEDVAHVADEEDLPAVLAELADGLTMAASELRRITAELQEARHADPSG